MKLLMYQTKILVRRLHRAHYHPSWSQQMRSDKTEKFTEKAFLSRKTCFKASSDTLSKFALPPTPPAYLHEESKTVQRKCHYRWSITFHQTSKTLHRTFCKGQSCLVLQPDLCHQHPPTLVKKQDTSHAGEGKRDPAEVLVENRAGDDQTVMVKDTSHSLRCDYSYP